MKHLPVFLLLIIILFNGCSKTPEEDPGKEPVTAGMHDSVMVIDGMKRSFLYYIPPAFSADNRPALTIVLHGMTQTGYDIIGTIFTSVGPDVDSINNIIVCPTAFSGHWNDRMGGIFPSTDTVDDVKFLSNLIDFFISEFRCNPKAVYVMGFSNGGMMTYRLSCDIPQKIRAIASFISMIGVVASQHTSEAPPLPVFITNGTADPIMLWNGGVVGTPAVPLLGVLLSNDDNVTYWLKRNQTYKTADITYLPDYCPGDSSRVVSYHYGGENEVVFNKVINGGHFAPVLRDRPIVPTFNCDFESVRSAWIFLHNH
ncbi:MAG: hypothetical protein WCI71_03470 [Bacteroidota bacterium]